MKYKFKRRFSNRTKALRSSALILKKDPTELKPFSALARNEEIDLFGTFDLSEERKSFLSRVKAALGRILPKRKMRPPMRASLLLKILSVSLIVALISAVVVVYSIFGAFGRRYRLLTVPDLIGMSEEEALTQSLDSFEYTVKYEYNPYMKAGCVISQTPPPNVERKLYASDERLSIGLTVNTAAPSTALQSVVGFKERDAMLLLKNAGIEVTVIEEWSDTFPSGVVSFCSYSSGEQLPVGQSVLIKVSRGKQIPLTSVPALCGLSESEAVARLEHSGLLVGQIKYQHSDAPIGRVIAQEYVSGSEIEIGKSVALTVSGGKNFE